MHKLASLPENADEDEVAAAWSDDALQLVAFDDRDAPEDEDAEIRILPPPPRAQKLVKYGVLRWPLCWRLHRSLHRLLH